MCTCSTTWQCVAILPANQPVDRVGATTEKTPAMVKNHQHTNTHSGRGAIIVEHFIFHNVKLIENGNRTRAAAAECRSKMHFSAQPRRSMCVVRCATAVVVRSVAAAHTFVWHPHVRHIQLNYRLSNVRACKCEWVRSDLPSFVRKMLARMFA